MKSALYLYEFPNYDTELKIPKGFQDYSYHNDVCPHVSKEVKLSNGTHMYFNIWQNYLDLDLRENDVRYIFQIEINYELIFNYPTNNWDDIETLIKAIQV